MKTIQFLFSLIAFFVCLNACEQDSSLVDPLTGMEINEPTELKDPASFEGQLLRNRIAFQPVIDPINGNVEVGKARLYRHRRGVSMTLYSKALIPGHAYTIWWVVFNEPNQCDAAPCGESDIGKPAVKCEILYATGKVVKRGTLGYFRAYLKEGDNAGSINDVFGLPEYGGLLDSKKAEVHLVVRSHGPAIPGQIRDQIGSFGGGCTTDLPAFTEVPDEVGECADIQFAVFEVK